MEEEEDDGSPPLMEPALPFDKQAKQLYPVSITWQPPFSMLVDLKGHGDLQAWLPRLSVIYAMHPMHAAAQRFFITGRLCLAERRCGNLVVRRSMCWTHLIRRALCLIGDVVLGL